MAHAWWSEGRVETWRPPAYADRADAGRRLGEFLARRRPPPSADASPRPLVLALPRGGVPVAFEVARILDADLDVLAVRKLGVPGQEELAFGAVAEGGTRVLNRRIAPHIPREPAERTIAAELAEVERRARAYREGRPLPEVTGRDVLLVDDGLATGATMLAAIRAVRPGAPAHLTVAVPVAAPDTVRDLSREAEIVSLLQPAELQAVGAWYSDFSQTTDDEVRALLARRAEEIRPRRG